MKNHKPFRSFAELATESRLGNELESFLTTASCADEHFYSTLTTVRNSTEGVKWALVKTAVPVLSP